MIDIAKKVCAIRVSLAHRGYKYAKGPPSAGPSLYPTPVTIYY